MMIIKMIVILIVISVLLFFAGQNDEIIKLKFGTYETFPAPVYLIIMISLVTGMVIALIMSFFDKWKLRIDLRKLKKEKKRMEGELTSLRKMPIVESPKTKLPEGSTPDAAKGS